MKVTISHEFACDPDAFWDKIFFDREFLKRLYVDELRFPQYDVIEQRAQGDGLVRRVRIMPKQDAPAAVQKLVGGAFSYVEEGTFERGAQRFRFRVLPSALADKIRTDGEVRTEALGPKRTRRVVDLNLEVKIFGVGGMVENFVAKSTRETYDRAAAITSRWITEKGL